MGVFEAVEQALRDKDNVFVECGRKMLPISHDEVPQAIKAKYIRSVVATVIEASKTGG